MRDGRVGRVLVASLHQAIGDILPTRLGFYENWLNAEGLREGTIGLAPLYAVLSFLRQEGEAYNHIATRAGEYAAEWTVASMPPLRRTTTGMMPTFLRRRVVLGYARALVSRSYEGTRTRLKVRRGTARVEVLASVFCAVREPVSHPLCGFYAAAFGKMLVLFGLDADVFVESCRGTGQPSCVLAVPFGAPDLAGKGEQP